MTCPVDSHSVDGEICDSFEVGIISHLEYEMYDIAVMITNTPKEILVHDRARISFRLSHVNDHLMTWFATIRLICLLISVFMMVLYFVSRCSRDGINEDALDTLNVDQYWVLALLFLCAIYDEPLFEFRRNNPSLLLSMLSEVPASLFFTALLSYWLMGITFVRVKAK